MEGLNGYDLSRNWFDFAFENTDIISPTHAAIYFYCIDLCNRLGWKTKFGFPSQLAMNAIGIKNWKTYNKAFDDLVNWGFIKVIQKSKNQYTATVIALVKNTKAHTKASTKAKQKHLPKQSRSTVDINKHINLKTNNDYVVGEKKIKIDDLEKEVLSWQQKKENACIAIKITQEQFDEYVKAVLAEWKIYDTEVPDNSDTRKHLISHIRKKHASDKKNQNGTLKESKSDWRDKLIQSAIKTCEEV